MHYFTGFSQRVNRAEIKAVELLSQKLQLMSYLGGKNNSPPPWKKTNKILSFTVSYLNCQHMISPLPFYFAV